MYTEVLVESRHGLRKRLVCFISAKRVCPYVDPANQDKDNHIQELKTQSMYGTGNS